MPLWGLSIWLATSFALVSHTCVTPGLWSAMIYFLHIWTRLKHGQFTQHCSTAERITCKSNWQGESFQWTNGREKIFSRLVAFTGDNVLACLADVCNFVFCLVLLPWNWPEAEHHWVCHQWICDNLIVHEKEGKTLSVRAMLVYHWLNGKLIDKQRSWAKNASTQGQAVRFELCRSQ